MQSNQSLADEGDVCSWRFAGLLDNPFRRLLQNPDKILGGLVKPGQTAVDLGCGPGFFSMALARLAGESGHVISVDLQPQMLDMARRRAAQLGLVSRMQFHQCPPDRIGIDQPVDFALAFWMVHEVPDTEAFLREIRSFLKPDARFLLAEPKFHVTTADFQKTVDLACAVGMRPCAEPSIRISRAVLLAPR
jgi:ubiquinone/menaquinone biosynthesis C-methylase UbiE